MNDFIKFYASCTEGNLERVRSLIEKVPMNDYNYNIGLNCGLQSGNMEIVRLMIKKGANNYINAIYFACLSGNIEIIQLMIEKGANGYNDGLTSACQTGNMEIAKLMIEKGANNYNFGLTIASQKGNVKIVKSMIENGANNYNDGLTYACKNQDINLIQLLIEKGANEIDRYYSFPNDKVIIQTLLSRSVSLKVFERINGFDQLLNIIKERENYILSIISQYIDANIINFLLKEYILNDII